MEDLEISAKTVEEATQKALAQLNAGLDEVEITVINEGKSGIMGLGAENARISVRPRYPEADLDVQIESVKDILVNILTRMGIQAAVEIQKQSLPVVLNITGDDLGMLIGRRGQTLDALQYLVRLISTRQANARVPIIIDVQNYKKQRFEDLRTLALNAAEQVKQKKSSLRLEPMSAYERRIIHMTLADDPLVATESMGEGEARKVVIIPKKLR